MPPLNSDFTLNMHAPSPNPPANYAHPLWLDRSVNRLLPGMRTSLVALILGLSASAANAQNLAISPSGITGGGGLSTGSRFTVNGSIGQAEATVSPLIGSRFVVTGGLHARAVVVQVAGAPFLNITLNAGSITLHWEADGTSYVIEESPVMGEAAVWTVWRTPNGNSSTFAPPGGTRFYRLRRISD